MDAVSELPMAEKKPGRSKRTSPQKSVHVVKGSDEWRDWLARLTDFSRMPTSVLVDVALKEWAERNGFPDPPPKR
jgi:hypothetical protein